jgi:hypothetical protein
MLDSMRRWFEVHQRSLSDKGIDVQVSQGIEESPKNLICANIRSARYECLIELWETGESDFHLLDWQHPEQEVVVTHYEFENELQLYAAIETMISRFEDLDSSGNMGPSKEMS